MNKKYKWLNNINKYKLEIKRVKMNKRYQKREPEHSREGKDGTEISRQEKDEKKIQEMKVTMAVLELHR